MVTNSVDKDARLETLRHASRTPMGLSLWCDLKAGQRPV
jgi:hypothetical protein